MFYKKGFLRNFSKFTGKHPCQRVFFNKIAGFRPATLLKKTLWHRCFPVNFEKFLRTPFFAEHLRWLLLHKDLQFDLHFSVYSLRLFLYYERNRSYRDNNMHYVTAKNLDVAIKSLEEDLIKLLQWLSDNRINASNDKCYLLVNGKDRVTKNANGFKIENTVYC